MPTKETRNALSPALAYLLLTGELPSARIPGWVEAAQLGTDQAGVLTEAWDEHGAGLMATAAVGGFIPWRASKQRPQGDGFTRWQQRFLQQHRY